MSQFQSQNIEGTSQRRELEPPEGFTRFDVKTFRLPALTSIFLFRKTRDGLAKDA